MRIKEVAPNIVYQRDIKNLPQTNKAFSIVIFFLIMFNFIMFNLHLKSLCFRRQV